MRASGKRRGRAILRDPVRWLGLVPRRLAATFDYAGAAGFYLHQSNPEAFDEQRKTQLGVVETVYERLAYLGASGGRRLRQWAAPEGAWSSRRAVRFASLPDARLSRGAGARAGDRAARAGFVDGPRARSRDLVRIGRDGARARHLFRSGEVFDGPVPLGDEPRFCLAFARNAPEAPHESTGEAASDRSEPAGVSLL